MGKLLVAIAVGIVFVVLCLGLYTLWRGGDTARTWSNRLMRIRVLAQFIAIVIIMMVLYLSQRLVSAPPALCKPPSFKTRTSTAMAKTLYDKIWDAHLVASPP